MCAYACFQTLGAEFVVKTVRIPESDNLAVELYLFDTSGHAIYKEQRPTYVSRSKTGWSSGCDGSQPRAGWLAMEGC